MYVLPDTTRPKDKFPYLNILKDKGQLLFTNFLELSSALRPIPFKLINRSFSGMQHLEFYAFTDICFLFQGPKLLQVFSHNEMACQRVAV